MYQISILNYATLEVIEFYDYSKKYETCLRHATNKIAKLEWNFGDCDIEIKKVTVVA